MPTCSCALLLQSIDFHERGKKHQTNVAKSLREVESFHFLALTIASEQSIFFYWQAREKGVKKQDAEEKLMQDLDAIEKVRARRAS